MELVYTQNFEYARETYFPQKKAGPTRSERIIAFLQYARPFLVLDILALGAAFFLHIVHKGALPTFAAAIPLYGILCFLFPKIVKRGLGGRYARCVIFTHLLFFLFYLVWLAMEILTRLRLFPILGFIGGGSFILINTFIVLPIMYKHHVERN